MRRIRESPVTVSASEISGRVQAIRLERAARLAKMVPKCMRAAVQQELAQ
jgi:hypothetical protein